MTTTQPTTTTTPSLVAPVLFTMTIFLSAALLFFVQPLFTKIVLPLVGGAPAVWTTAMLFFQTVLIGGYLYAHLSTKYLPVIAQVILHLALWAIALFFLPLSVQAGWQFDPDGTVAVQTLALFALGVGMPFAVLSANAPLIQSWYAKSGGPSADDPYFLYGASNLGSLIALLAFPLVAEPLFGAGQIGFGWAFGFVALGVLLATSGLLARKGATMRATAPTTEKPTFKDYGFWLFLAFIPSSLMLAVTTTISTDLGSFPLIWVIPLSLFLLTFVLTFTNRTFISDELLNKLFVTSLGVFAIKLSGVIDGAITITVTGALVLAFFFVSLKAHRLLYRARPGESNLTIFYVTMSVGGALGGLFNSLLAPSLFSDLRELHVTVVLAALLLLYRIKKPTSRQLTTTLIVAVVVIAPVAFDGLIAPLVGKDVRLVLVGVVPLAALFVLYQNRVGAFCAIILLMGLGILNEATPSLFKDRSFFGRHLVKDTAGIRLYQNGTTIHGAQNVADFAEGQRPTPLFYYHPEAPMAQIVNSEIGKTSQSIGIVGLGVGSLACYAQPGQAWQFYEIDAMVDQVARDPALFTFMSTCAPDAPTHIGDARIVLETQTDTRYDILVIDAYSSDAVPVHLTTHEAMELYRDRLTENGILALHISNRYYQLERPIARSAAQMGMAAYWQNFKGDPEDPTNSGSVVAMLTNDASTLAPLTASGQWKPLETDGGQIWTDDYANLLSILRGGNGG